MVTRRASSWRSLGGLSLLAAMGACNLVVPLDDLGSGTSSGSGAAGGQAPTGGGGAGASSTGGDNAGGGGDGGNGTGNTSTGSAYGDAVLADEPLAYWPLDEARGAREVLDRSGNEHTGFVQGGVVFGAEGAFGTSTAASFDGSSKINFGDKFDFAGLEPFSVEFWMSTPLPDEGFGYLGKASTTPEGGHTGWFIADGSGVIQGIRGSANVTTPVLLPNQYTHIVMTYDGLFLSLYLNGEIASEQPSTAMVPSHANPFLIGEAYQWSSYLGLIDEVAVYDYALPVERVAAHYAAARQ
jgi:trimeric autotransporter adhesin